MVWFFCQLFQAYQVLVIVYILLRGTTTGRDCVYRCKTLCGVKTKNDALQNSPGITFLPVLGKPHVSDFPLPFSLSFATVMDVSGMTG